MYFFPILTLLLLFLYFFCNCRILAFFLLSVLRFQYLVNSVKTVTEITSCPYSEIPVSRMELRQLPTSVPCGLSPLLLFPISRAATKVNTLGPMPCSLTGQMPYHLAMALTYIFFLENATFLSHLPMSKQIFTTSTIHRFRHEEWTMMAVVMSTTTK